MGGGHDVAAAQRPHLVREHVPTLCSGCGCGCGCDCALPPISLHRTQHRLQYRRCGHGMVTVVGAADELPAGVHAPTPYGPCIQAVAKYLAFARHLPFARIAQTLVDLLGAPVSTGTLAKAAAGLGPFHATVPAELAGAPVVHFDETGTRVAGTPAWVH